ncbi:MAG: nitrilase-related carbon-nitrogen hydrolase [Candidatus Thorarchaeota archaeon]|jgi:predicted amidohydrolase
MRLAVGQMEPVIANIAENISRVKALLGEAEENSVDVLLLPELVNSGYVFESEEEAVASAEEIPTGPLSSDLRSWSDKGRMVVAGICEKTKEGLYNSAGVFADGKHIGTYRKIQLFLNERNWFLPGYEEPLVVEFRGNKFGVMICFDWAFPEIARVLTLKGAQVILHLANLVLPYCQDAMITRSIENRVFTATANRVGIEREVTFSGHSQITSPTGERLATINGEEIGITWCDIDPTVADDKMITKRNHIINDRRPDLYSRLIQDD